MKRTNVACAQLHAFTFRKHQTQWKHVKKVQWFRFKRTITGIPELGCKKLSEYTRMITQIMTHCWDMRNNYTWGGRTRDDKSHERDACTSWHFVTSMHHENHRVSVRSSHLVSGRQITSTGGSELPKSITECKEEWRGDGERLVQTAGPARFELQHGANHISFCMVSL